jgi:hypothetical protein
MGLDSFFSAGGAFTAAEFLLDQALTLGGGASMKFLLSKIFGFTPLFLLICSTPSSLPAFESPSPTPFLTHPSSRFSLFSPDDVGGFFGAELVLAARG